MKKFILSMALVVVFALGYSTNVVPVETAMKASQNFLSERVGAQNAKALTLTHVYTEFAEDGTPVYYRFQVGEKGFMLVSATDLATPVLAYSLESNYTPVPAADYYCNKYKQQLSFLIDNPVTALKESKVWNKYLSEDFRSVSSSKASEKKVPYVEPLVTTKWTQEKYYNTMCPISIEPKSSTDYRTVVGCVALSMSNLLYYYRYPLQGKGAVWYIPQDYDSETGELITVYPPQQVNFAHQTYNYDAMYNSLQDYAGEVSKLIYNAGVSVRMNYGAEGSSSQTELALEALQTNFKYTDKAKIQYIRDVITTPDQAYLWVNAAKEELDNHRPILFSGVSESAGGHAWIVDGYTTLYDTVVSAEPIITPAVYQKIYDTTYTYYCDTVLEGEEEVIYCDTNMEVTLVSTILVSPADTAYGDPDTTVTDLTYFHVNWGWAGSDNGYYLINNQNTSGYGNFNFNEGEAMLLNMAPEDSCIAKPTTGDVRITAAKGTISDGAGNQKYKPNTNRSWVIACPNATSYRLNFSRLKTKPGDKVIIYNGGTSSSPVLNEYSGNYLMAACADYTNIPGCIHGDFVGQNLPAAVNVNKDSVLVVFITNEDDETDYGFVLDYEATQINGTRCSNMKVVTSMDQNVLTDKAYDEQGNDNPYLPQTECSWRIQVPGAPGYTYSFPKFDLKEGDFVEIFDVTSSNDAFIAHYDVNSLPTAPVTAFSPKMLVRFVSDNWIQGNGFEFEFSLVTGINEIENANVNVYPNPATNLLNVAIQADEAQDFTATIVDMTGKTIYADQFNYGGGEQTFRVPVTSLAKGIYFLNLQSQKGKVIRKFIVE